MSQNRADLRDEPDAGRLLSAPGPESDPVEAPVARRVEIHLPAATIVKVFAAILAGFIVIKLWPLLLLTFLAVLLAVTLQSGIDWLTRRRTRKWVAFALVVGGFFGALGAFLALVLPALGEQFSNFGENLPALRDEFLNWFSPGGFVREKFERLLGGSSGPEVETWIKHLASWSGLAFGGIAQCILLLVITFYLLVDGRKTFEWVIAFFPPPTRKRLWKTSGEVMDVIFAYVMGQVVTSMLVAIYCFIVLSLLQVPAALILALLAGLMDLLPVLGFFLSVTPAFLLALSVSLNTALAVLGFYLLYHALEVYVIAPKIYGKKLRLSPLTVVLGFLVGAILAGIPGALAALPLIASYSAIEQIWLKPFLGENVTEKHEALKIEAFGEVP